MKQLLTACLCLAFLGMNTLSAQNLDYRHTATANIGQSTIGLLAKVGEKLIEVQFESDDAQFNIGAVDVSASPVFEGTYDYGINEWFSLGASAANQKFSIAYTDFEFINDEQDQVTIESFEGKMNRFNLTLRPNFHYGNIDRVDMYSGFRLGLTVYTFSIDGEVDADERLAELVTKFAKIGSVVPTGSLTLFGIRYYLTDNIGLNAEFNAGAPYFAKMGVAARF